MFDPAGMRVVYGALAFGLLLGGCARVVPAVAYLTGSAAAPRPETKPDPVGPAEENYEMLYAKADLMVKLGDLDDNLASHWYCEAAGFYSQVVEIAPEGTRLQTAAREAVRLWGNCLSYADYGKETTEQALNAFKLKPSTTGGGAASSQGVPDPEWLHRRRMTEIDQKMLEVFGAAIVHQPESAALVNVKYRLARIYYKYNYFDEAAILYKDVAENHPRSSLALASAYFLLDCLASKFFIENHSGAMAHKLEAQVGKFLTLPELTNDPDFVVLLKKVIVSIHRSPLNSWLTFLP